jgi:acetyl esterase/lipase
MSCWTVIGRLVRVSLRLVLAVVVLAAAAVLSLIWYFHPEVTRTDDVVYGRRGGRDLAMTVLQPASPNGLGLALMVSGGWKSKPPGEVPAWMCAPLLRRGYTVFAVCHVSQPEATVMEIVDDVSRGIRFIRHHAREYGIDPDRLGVTGGSAGGHLSLMLATRGGPGPPDAPDPIDRLSSAVQAVAIFYPVTDLLDLGDSTENLGDGGPPKSFIKAFGPEATDLARWKDIGREMSPLHHIGATLPPILIHHGDADTLVTLDQSERFQSRAREFGHTVDLVVHRGGGHGWLTMLFDIRRFADWFDRHLGR